MTLITKESTYKYKHCISCSSFTLLIELDYATKQNMWQKYFRVIMTYFSMIMSQLWSVIENLNSLINIWICFESHSSTLQSPEKSTIYFCLNLSPSFMGHLAQSVICLAADQGIMSLIPARSRTLVEMDHERISVAIHPPSADSRRVVVSYKQKYVHEVLVNRLVKLAQEKVWLVELTLPTWH